MFGWLAVPNEQRWHLRFRIVLRQKKDLLDSTVLFVEQCSVENLFSAATRVGKRERRTTMASPIPNRFVVIE